MAVGAKAAPAEDSWHRSGTQSARTTIETCARLKIEALTLYAFSVENWRRPKTEIDFLMALLRDTTQGDAAATEEPNPDAVPREDR